MPTDTIPANTKCFHCGAGTLVSQKVELEGFRNGESFVVSVDGMECAQCGFKTIGNDQSVEFTRLLSDAYRRTHGLLTGAEIRLRRTRMKLNQRQFADYLGVGVASVKRWETGQVQDRAMDELIRLKTDPMIARQNLEDLQRRTTTTYVESVVVSYTEESTILVDDAEILSQATIHEDEILTAA